MQGLEFGSLRVLSYLRQRIALEYINCEAMRPLDNHIHIRQTVGGSGRQLTRSRLGINDAAGTEKPEGVDLAAAEVQQAMKVFDDACEDSST